MRNRGNPYPAAPPAGTKTKRKRKMDHSSPFCRALSLFLILLITTAPAAGSADWRPALGPWNWHFPQDHGNHPSFRTEWWYFTGNLTDGAGRRYGYQLTFFRQGIRRIAAAPANPWSLGDAYFAHFAVTDVSRAKFFHADRISRSGPGLAGAATGRMEVWNLNWFARMEGQSIRIGARHGPAELALKLRPIKPVVLHSSHGLSKKGPHPGQAAHYYSFTSLATTGTLKTADGGETVNVRGTSWFDHEFTSNALAADQAGWDWFSLHCSDGRDLMIYLMRKADGSWEKESSGTIVESDGKSRHLHLSEFTIALKGHWTSARTGARYPVRWQIDIPAAALQVSLAPLLADQELTTPGSMGVTYYEGAVAGKGYSRGKPVVCEGYIEMTGYAEKMGSLF